MSSNQLNKIQIRAEVLTVISKLQTMPDVDKVDDILSVLIEQEDKKTILEILVKELLKTNEQKAILICYLLLKLCEEKELEEALWDILKNPKVSDLTKSIVLNLLKDMGNKVDYERLDEYFENPDEVIDADTQNLLHVALMNPEAQIDFLDFLQSLNIKDKMALVNSLGEDYSLDSLANILFPVFLHTPNSELGRKALEILGTTKSQLALHSLSEALDFVKDEEIISAIKKNISALKIAGVREDNTEEFYREVLSSSRPYKSFASYPDGQGNMALIFSREREDDSIQMFASVVNDIWGVIDCFGFNEISKNEFERIVSRFYGDDERVFIDAHFMKTLLKKAEKLTRDTEGVVSYEFICWKTLLSDITEEPVPIEITLSSRFQKKQLEKSELEKIYLFDFVQRWFFTTEDNDEFKTLIDTLNIQITQSDFTFDLEETAVNATDEIFNAGEKSHLDKRILLSSYLKFLSGEMGDSGLLFSLYYDEKQKQKLAQNIVRKSIYEYYITQKFKIKEEKKMTNIFALKKPKAHELSLKQIELMIDLIESLWVEEDV